MLDRSEEKQGGHGARTGLLRQMVGYLVRGNSGPGVGSWRQWKDRMIWKASRNAEAESEWLSLAVVC